MKVKVQINDREVWFTARKILEGDDFNGQRVKTLILENGNPFPVDAKRVLEVRNDP